MVTGMCAGQSAGKNTNTLLVDALYLGEPVSSSSGRYIEHRIEGLFNSSLPGETSSNCSVTNTSAPAVLKERNYISQIRGLVRVTVSNFAMASYYYLPISCKGC